MSPAYGDILSFCHHHCVIADDCRWSLMALQVDFHWHADVQMHLSLPSVQLTFCALLPRFCRHIEPIRQFMAAIMLICQVACNQIALGKH